MFFRTLLRVDGREILINLARVENVYNDGGSATFVMLPVGDRQSRAFETQCPFVEAASRLLAAHE